jgi:hypothetical protein
MFLDPIVSEIRAVRERIAIECDCDFHKMCQRGEETLRHWKGRIVTKEELCGEESQWNKSFARSGDKLVEAARKAKIDISQGLAAPLKPDDL